MNMNVCHNVAVGHDDPTTAFSHDHNTINYEAIGPLGRTTVTENMPEVAEKTTRCDFIGTEPDLLDTSRNLVTLEEAREGLLKLIYYLQANPPIPEVELQMFDKILEYLDKRAEDVCCPEIKGESDDDHIDTEASDETMLQASNDIQSNIKIDPDDHTTYAVPMVQTNSDTAECDQSDITNLDSSLNDTFADKKTSRKPRKRTSESFNESKTRQYREGIYQCNVCSIVFSNAKKHWDHMECHKDYICEVCGRRSTCKANLIIHMKIHDGKRPHACQYCRLGFEEPQQLEEHISIHYSDDGRYKCHACDNLFKTKKRLSFHILKDHPDNLPFICTFCDKTFINASKLSTHMHVHTRDKMDPSTLKENASISEDPIIYSRLSESTMKSVDIASSNLNVKKANRKMRNPTHKKSKATTHKKADCESKTRNYAEGVYPCKVCGVILNNSKRHWHHMESHKDYICKVCGHKSNCKASLITHMKRHDRTPLHTCNYCKKGFEQPEHLAEHIKIHSGLQPFVCMTCNATFNKSRELSSHMMSHGDNRPHKCKLCHKAYKQRPGLDFHMLKHKGTKEHMCSKCGKCFATVPQLRKHMVVHSKEKKHVCKVCDRAFTHYSGLYVHSKTHTDERPFTCTLCDKSFSCASHFARHMQIHTGQKSYQCDTCGKKFPSTGNLKRHSVVHTGIKPYVCPVCDGSFTQVTTLKIHLQNVHDQLYTKYIPGLENEIDLVGQTDIVKSLL